MTNRPSRWQSIAILAACAVLLTSCRGVRQGGPGPLARLTGAGYTAPAPSPQPTLQPYAAPQAYAMPAGYAASQPAASVPGEAMAVVQTAAEEPIPAGAPAPVAAANPVGPWAPPGLPQPWPYDEYLADGGDDGNKAVVGPQWQVNGLEPEDTVAHYDTIDGRRVVEASNRVHIYSPRFAAVRQVVGLNANEQATQVQGIHLPTKLVRHDETIGPVAREQRQQVVGETAQTSAGVYQSRQGDGVFSQAVGMRAFQDGFKPYENLTAIRLGQMEEAEMAFLAQGVQAAIAWTDKQAVQVILDRQTAVEETSDQNAENVFSIHLPGARPKLRIIKIASTQTAQPGDTVDFTLRFDNVGNQVIGNVTILDNLTGRLEYLPESAQCNLPANFLTEANQAGSLTLRWEVTDPLKPGQGGIIRFRCRVR